MLTKIKTEQSGLTLIELTIVIVILGILATFIAPRIINAPQKARVSKARVELANIQMALELYAIDVGNYPTTEQGLNALWQMPTPNPQNWEGPYLKDRALLDPWNNAYVYRYPSTYNQDGYELYSYGKDGKLGGEELDADITNWSEAAASN